MFVNLEATFPSQEVTVSHKNWLSTRNGQNWLLYTHIVENTTACTEVKKEAILS